MFVLLVGIPGHVIFGSSVIVQKMLTFVLTFQT